MCVTLNLFQGLSLIQYKVKIIVEMLKQVQHDVKAEISSFKIFLLTIKSVPRPFRNS